MATGRRDRRHALAVCAFVPGAVLAGASGLLFGAALGAVLAVVSATLGATLAFLLARAGAKRPYRALATARVTRWTTRIERRGFLAVMYARLAPGAPFALVSYAAGITRIRLVAFAAATALAAAPCAFAYAALGGNLHNYTSPPALAAIAVLAATTIVGPAILWRARPRQPGGAATTAPTEEPTHPRPAAANANMAADRTRPWRRTTPAALITVTVAGVIAATTLGSSGLGARHRQPPHRAAERPAAPLMRRLTIGRSVNGSPIRAIRIGQAGDSRTLLIVGCIHGNEPAGIAIARHLATPRRRRGARCGSSPTSTPTA